MVIQAMCRQPASPGIYTRGSHFSRTGIKSKIGASPVPLSHTHTHTRTHFIVYTSLSHTHTLFCIHHSHTRTHTHTLTVCISHSPDTQGYVKGAHTYTHTHTHSQESGEVCCVLFVICRNILMLDMHSSYTHKLNRKSN